jgi:hypothetical protein
MTASQDQTQNHSIILVTRRHFALNIGAAGIHTHIDTTETIAALFRLIR